MQVKNKKLLAIIIKLATVKVTKNIKNFLDLILFCWLP